MVSVYYASSCKLNSITVLQFGHIFTYMAVYDTTVAISLPCYERFVDICILRLRASSAVMQLLDTLP